MADYQHKPGNGSAFKNKNKQAQTHADFNGTYLDDSGKEHWFNLWVKKDKNGNEYFSFSTKPKS